MRSGAGVPDDGTTGGSADPLAAAAGLRWARPDLTAALADHILETAAVADDRGLWLRAAGWAVHARSATGDGRDTAADIIDCLPDWGFESLRLAEAGRLRVELALVSVNIGRSDVAGMLLEPVVVEGAGAELRADAFGVLARCAAEDDAGQVEGVLSQAEEAWDAAGAAHSDIGRASAALIGAAAHRRAGRPELAVDRAAAGLARLEGGPGQSGVGCKSGHLAAALAAEWIIALLDAGQTAEAVRGCAELAPRLEDCRPSRQLARLRLAVARTNAARSSPADTAHELSRAVRDAAECDAPDLEAVCCSALGTVYEKAGRPDIALTTVERGVAAQRVDRGRDTRFREALATLPTEVLAVDHGFTGRARPTRAVPPVGGEAPDLTRPAVGSSWSGQDVPTAAVGGPRPAPDDTQRLEAGSEIGAGSARGIVRPLGPRSGADDLQPRRAASESPAPAGSGDRGRGPGSGRNGSGSGLTRPASSAGPGAGSPPGAGRSGTPPRNGSPVSGSGAATRPAADSGNGRGRTAPGTGSADAATSRMPAAGSGNGLEARVPDAERDDPGSTRRSRHGLAIDRAWQVGEFATPGTPGSSAAPVNGGGKASSGRSTGTDPAARDGERDSATSDSPIGDLVLRSLRSAEAPSSRPADRAGREPASRSASDALTRPSTPDATENRTNGSGGRRRLADAADETRGADPGSAGEARRGRRPAGTAPPAARKGDAPDTGRGVVDDAGSTTPSDKDDNDRPAPRRTATEELEARRAAAGRSDPSTVVADWLAAELADLQRIWERISEPAVAGAGLQPELPSGAQDCVVSVDIARDGRRQVGRQPAKLVRLLAAALAEHLPAGSRTEQDEPCVLSVVLVGEDRLSAEEWMRRTLPELLDGDLGDLRAPGLQLRAAVRDAGAAGPQFVHDLGVQDRSSAGTDDVEDERPAADRPTGRAARRRAEEELSRPGLAAAGHRRDGGRSKRTEEPDSGADERDRSAPAAIPFGRRNRAAGSGRTVPDPGASTELISGGPSTSRADAPVDGAVGRADTTIDVPRRRRSRSVDPVAEPDAPASRSGRRRAGSAAEREPAPDADRPASRAAGRDDRSSDVPAAADRAGAARSRSGRSRATADPTGDRPARVRRDFDALDSYSSDRSGPGRFRSDRFGPDRSGAAAEADGASTDRGGDHDGLPSARSAAASESRASGRRDLDRDGSAGARPAGDDRNGSTSARSDRAASESRASRDPDRAGLSGIGSRRAGEDRAEPESGGDRGPDVLGSGDPGSDAGASGRAGIGRAGSGRRRRVVPDPLDPATSLDELRSEPPAGGGAHAGPDRAGGHRMSAGDTGGFAVDAPGSEPPEPDRRRSDRRGSARFETDLLGSDPGGSGRRRSDPLASDLNGSDLNGSARRGSNPLGSDRDEPESSGPERPGSHRNGSSRPGSTARAPESLDVESRGAHGRGSDTAGDPAPDRTDPDRRSSPRSRRGGTDRDEAPGRRSTGTGSAAATNGRPTPSGKGRRRADRVRVESGDPAGAGPAPARHAGADRPGRPRAGDGAAGSPSDSDPPPVDGDGNGREQPGPARRRIDASTEGLGLADLLAGALAEYRGI